MDVIVAVPFVIKPMTMIVGVPVIMVMGGRAMIVVVVAALAVIVGGSLGLEGAGDRGGGAALAAHEFGSGTGHVEYVRRDLGGHVAAAELPGEAQETGGILGPHLEERLSGGADRDEAAILQAHGVAVLEGRGLGERQGEAQAALPRQGLGRGLPGGVIEDDGIDDRVGADGDLTDDGGGAQHEFLASERAGSAAGMERDGASTKRVRESGHGFCIENPRHPGAQQPRFGLPKCACLEGFFAKRKGPAEP
jgi:hypothetical protein